MSSGNRKLQGAILDTADRDAQSALHPGQCLTCSKTARICRRLIIQGPYANEICERLILGQAET
jgi:hypothetical protein